MLYKYLPYFIFKLLFGDRREWGTKPDYTDDEFIKWRNDYHLQFYNDTQKSTIGTKINHFGFSIMKEVDLTNKVVLEIGPGIIEHLDYNDTKPTKYILVDIKKEFLALSSQSLKSYDIDKIVTIQVQDLEIPLKNNSIDVIITFHQLEHIYELDKYLQELKRILKPNGILIGAVPCEGGIVWGLGRFLTTRKYVKKNMNINYDKIICWEHPNFVSKIKKLLDKNFINLKSIKKPFSFLPFDMNLSWSFIYRNDKNE